MSNNLPALIDNDVTRLAEHFVKSGFFMNANEVSKAVVQIVAGRELGFTPVASMTNIHIVKGKVVLGYILIGSAIKRSGKYDYKIVKHDNTICLLDFYENGIKVGESSFSMEDAKAAGLTTKDNWRQYPRNMLFARALANGVRWYCPDVFGGVTVYESDEIDGTFVETEEQPKTEEPEVAQPPGWDELTSYKINVTGKGPMTLLFIFSNATAATWKWIFKNKDTNVQSFAEMWIEKNGLDSIAKLNGGTEMLVSYAGENTDKWAQMIVSQMQAGKPKEKQMIGFLGLEGRVDADEVIGRENWMKLIEPISDSIWKNAIERTNSLKAHGINPVEPWNTTYGAFDSYVMYKQLGNAKETIFPDAVERGGSGEKTYSAWVDEFAKHKVKLDIVLPLCQITQDNIANAYHALGVLLHTVSNGWKMNEREQSTAAIMFLTNAVRGK